MSEGSPRRRPASDAHLSIGEVLTRLRPEFPDVTVSKIRFLESEGLIEPARAPSGYRKFSLRDVERLRYVLGTQRDHYLPLRVIREHLDAIDRGAPPPALPAKSRPTSTPRQQARLPEGSDFVTGEGARLTRAELVEAAGIASDLLKKVEDAGLVRAIGGKWYDHDALEVATVVARMTDYGFEPRHLRSFRAAAEREAGLVEQAVAYLSGRKDPESVERAGEVARELSALSVRLHTALVRGALSRNLRG